MAFPTVSNDVGSNSWLPINRQPGDIILIVGSISRSGGSTSNKTLTFPNVDGVAWQSLGFAPGTSTSTSYEFATYLRVVSASSTDMSDPTAGGSWELDGAFVYLIRGSDPNTAPELTFASGADPSALTPSWGADDTLWFVGASQYNSAPTAGPSGYTGFERGSFITGAYRTNHAATENPGAFTGGSGTGTSVTIAIRTAHSSDVIAYATDFSEYTDGVQPSDWTERWSTGAGSAVVTSSGLPSGVHGTKALKINTTTAPSGASGNYALSWNEPADAVDVEMVARVLRPSSVSAGGAARRPILHGGGDDTTKFGYTLDEDLGATPDAVEMGVYNNGTWSAVAQDTNEPLAADTWHWFRMQRTGTTIRARWWADGTTEPGTWNLSGTNTVVGSGWQGLGTNSVSATIWCDYFGVGLNGATIPLSLNTAPTADAGSDQSVFSGSNVSLAGTGSDPEGDTLTYSWAVTDADGSGLTTGDLTGATTATPSFTAPSVVSAADIVLTLTVTDTGGLTDTDTVTVTVNPVNVLADVTGSGGPLIGGDSTVDTRLINIVIAATGAGGIVLDSTTVIDPSLIDILLNLTGAGGASVGGAAGFDFVKVAVQPVESVVKAPTFEVSLVARTPAASGAPTLAEIDRLAVDSIQYSHELNQPGSAALGVPIGSMSDAVKTRLANLAAHPCEVRIYYNSELQWAGEVQTLGIDGQTVQLGCVGLLGYVYRMGITKDYIFTAEDQFTVVKTLIDDWQSQTYGNFGLTVGSGLSGVEIDQTYLRDDLNNVGSRLEDLCVSTDGFDMRVDPETRELVLTHPRQGVNRSATVVLDERCIDSAQVAISIGPDDLMSDIYVNGTTQGASGESEALTTEIINESVWATYGRTWGSFTVDGDTDQDSLDQRGIEFGNSRSVQLLQPGATLLARQGTSPGDFGPGDVVGYAFDAGLGLQSGNYRVASVSVSVDGTGALRLSVEFV